MKNQAHLIVFIYLFTDAYPACSSLLVFPLEIPEESWISECMNVCFHIYVCVCVHVCVCHREVNLTLHQSYPGEEEEQ